MTNSNPNLSRAPRPLEVGMRVKDVNSPGVGTILALAPHTWVWVEWDWSVEPRSEHLSDLTPLETDQ